MHPSATVRLGRTDLAVTRLGLGTGSLGHLYEPVSDENAQSTIDQAFALGIGLYDTAPFYGEGLAEVRLGQGLRRHGGNFVLATKVGRLIDPRLGVVFDFSYDGVLRSVEESLGRLGLDRVDILHIHDADDHEAEAIDGAYPALDRLRSEGVIKAVGAGMNQAEMLARFAQRGDFDCFLLAGRYTILDQSGLETLLPICLERSISIIIGGPYNSGILADPRPGAPFNYAPASADRVERAQALDRVCRRHGVPLKAAAIQFPFGHPAVATVLTGARSPAEVEENEAMMRVEIPAALWTDLVSEGLLGPEVPVPSSPAR